MRRPVSVAVILLSTLFGCSEGPPDSKAPRFEPGAVDAPEVLERVAEGHLAAGDVLRDIDDLRVRSMFHDPRGVAHVRMDQLHRGVPVLGGQVIVHVPADGKPIGTTDRLVHELDLDVTPVLDDVEAIAIARNHAERPDATLDAAELMILRQEGVDHLAWRIALRDLTSGIPSLPVAFVDAATGEIVLAYDNLQTALDRETFDANASVNVPSTPARVEGDPAIGKAAVDDCHDHSGTTWDYYDQFQARDSFDDGGSTITSIVELQGTYQGVPVTYNAFWDGVALHYGSGGSGPGFGQALDVVAHEFTHGVTQYTADLVYTQQSGGLNEATSDIMAAVVESWNDGWVVGNNTTWAVGEDLGGAFRSMINPQVGSYLNYNNNLNVHVSSGIANRAFVEFVADPALTIEEAGDIWYTALTGYMTPLTTFEEARSATQQATLDLYGAGPELAAVSGGWDYVDVPGTPAYTIFDEVGPISLSTNQSSTYTFTPSANAVAVRFLLVGDDGDADIYVSNGATPTTNTYDCRSITPTSREICTFDPLSPGSYTVLVDAFSSFSGATLYAWEAVPGGLCPDNDLDGSTTCDGDCDDLDPAVYPGAPEVCNDIDDDCDGTIDGPASIDATPWHDDVDGDGYGDPATGIVACDAPTGTVADDTDCDDTAPAVHPGAEEVCNDVDDDCDGTIDGPASTDATPWYDDVDGDGYGDAAAVTVACDAPTGAVADDTDCDDAAPAVYPGADELCNNVDDDCDGTVDGPDSLDALTWYVDGDGDGYGDVNQVRIECVAPAGTVATAGDCDDVRGAVNPGATEVCNSRDDDCDGTVDGPASADARSFYADSDGDGFGDPSRETVECSAPAGTVSNRTDCDDGAAAVHPGALEVCNGIDDDCDNVTDPSDAAGSSLWYRDGDGDSFGDLGTTQRACTQPAGFVAGAGDCDDGAAAVNPNASERCNGFDDNCDSVIDPPSSVDAGTWYVDGDGDGYGDPLGPVVACSAPPSHVDNPDDCDDRRNDVSPAAPEVCDALDVDENCDGTAEESGAVGEASYWLDTDGDGFGDPATEAMACDWPALAVIPGQPDCDDSAGTTFPGADEICDGVDQDCDDLVDDDAIDFSVFYVDGDGDGFGLEPVEACEQPDGTALVDGDCDDGDASINPEADEIPDDDIDQDCDGADLIGSGPTDTGTTGPGPDRPDPADPDVGCSGCAQGSSGMPLGSVFLGLFVLMSRRRRASLAGFRTPWAD